MCKKMLCSFAALALSVATASTQSVPRNFSIPPSPRTVPPTPAALAGRRATWRLEWDDRVDGVLQVGPKSCLLTLAFADSKVEGSFVGPVLGASRRATFAGDLFTSPNCGLLVLRQVEGDYVCAYQLQSLDGASYVGVWHDNNGASGDVRLRRIGRAPV